MKLNDFRLSKNYLVILLLSYYFMTATTYIPVYIDIHFFYKDDYKNVEVQIYLKNREN